MAERRDLFIQGLTRSGQAFRPSDWPERLAGAMESFRPTPPPGGLEAFIAYSPYCEPRIQESVKGVFLDARLHEVEPMAWYFVMNFARDNDLVVVDAKPEAA